MSIKDTISTDMSVNVPATVERSLAPQRKRWLEE